MMPQLLMLALLSRSRGSVNAAADLAIARRAAATGESACEAAKMLGPFRESSDAHAARTGWWSPEEEEKCRTSNRTS